jgi:hypothetical protein
MKIQEKENAEGTLWRETWEAYTACTKSLWKKYPEVLAAGFGLTYPYYPLEEPGSGRKTRVSSFRQSTSFILHPHKNRVGLTKCDIVLFHSSSKPGAQGPITALADRLTRRGYRCAVFSSSDMHLWQRDNSNPAEIQIVAVDDYKQRFIKGSGYLSSLKKWGRSAYISFKLLSRIRREAPAALSNLFTEPSKTIHQLLLSSHRLAAANEMLKQLEPSLLITMHERLPIISEVLLAKQSLNTPKILYHYEEPLIQSYPVISKTVLVWNKTAEAELLKFAGTETHPDISIVGNYEIDSILEGIRSRKPFSVAEEDFRKKTRGKPVLLYLSQYGQLGAGFTKSPREATEWLEYAAEHCPEWCFIIKPRPFHYNKNEPGSESLVRHDNVLISPEEMTMAQLLRWPSVKVVASIYSTGLCAAAGAGKTALRLLVPHRKEAHPVIDEVAACIDSPEALVKALNDLHQARQEVDIINTSIDREDPRFPYRGHTIERMEELCLKFLASNNRREYGDK